MRLKRHAPLLESALKRAAARPLFSSQCTRRRYSSSSAAHPERIAILGGGISGLSSAYFLAKEFPNTKITVYESSKQTGGWIRSNRVDVDGGTALFEYGPRTLRNSAPTLQIIQELGLVSEVLSTDNDAPGAKKKYIYYPDRLNALPTETPGPLEMLKLYNSGILDGALGVFMESFRPRRHLSVTDETIGSFLARRVDKRIANNIVSAVFHGIYAGDIWQLSAKTLLPLAWNLEARYGCALKGFVQLQGEDPTPQQLTIYNPYDLRAWRAVREEIHLDPTFVEQLRNASVMTFKGGLGRLVGKLQETLERNPNVSIKPGSPIQSFKMVEGEPLQVEVVAGNGPSQTRQNYDLVISTLRNKSLTPYVTVMTVNMFFPRENLLPVQGFGYLIPQSVPFEQNPERALGVIFDSDAISGQDTAKGTKVTVMLGGHWWDNWAGYPDEQEGLELAKSVLKRHLNINAEPTATHVNLSQDCIPQYTVGYEDRLKDFAKGLQDEYKGRLRVVGNQFNGVGVNDCIKAAWLLARDLRGDGWKSTSCGLDRALQDGTLTIAPMSEMQYIYEKP